MKTLNKPYQIIGITFILICFVLVFTVIYTSLGWNSNKQALSVAISKEKSQTCAEFHSCEEALQIYKDGNVGLDNNHDGIPCNNLCKNDLRN